MSAAPELSGVAPQTRAELLDAARLSLPTPTGLWQRLTRVGVTRSMAPADAKYVILINTFVVLNVVVSSLLLFNPDQTVSSRLILFSPMVILLLCMALNWQRRYALAALALNAVAFVASGAQVFVSGVNGGAHLYLLIVIVAPFFTFPRDRSWLALGVACLPASLFVLAGVYYRELDLVPAPSPIAFTLGVTGAAALAAALGYYTRRVAREAEALTELKRQQTDLLVRAVLPPQVAARLKGTRAAERSLVAEQHERVSVVVCDIAGFTALSETMPPEELVGLLDALFSEFDELGGRARVEKIRTLGDAYIAATGLRDGVETCTDRALSFAQGIIDVTRAFAHRRGLQLGVRVGIATGPAVAGVIGTIRLSYDLWGPAVHRATALEAAAPRNGVALDSVTYATLAERDRYVSIGSLRGPDGSEFSAYAVSGATRDA